LAFDIRIIHWWSFIVPLCDSVYYHVSEYDKIYMENTANSSKFVLRQKKMKAKREKYNGQGRNLGISIWGCQQYLPNKMKFCPTKRGVDSSSRKKEKKFF
jgi:hypothetical protein